MFNRPLRSHLDLVKPDIGATIQERQFQQQRNHDVRSKDREFQIDDTVFFENFGQGSKWLAGNIDEVRGPLTYMVKLSDGRLVKRHVDHIRNRTSTKPSSSHNVIPLNDERLSFGPLLNSEESQPEQSPQSQEQQSIPIRSSSCVRRPPDRFCPNS